VIPLRVALLALVGILTLAAGGCGGSAEPAPTGRADLRVVQSLDFSGAIPIEGEYSYVRIESPSGASIAEERLPEDGRVTIHLSPDSYRLISYQRICNGNCGYLEPPSEQCSSTFEISGDKPLVARIRVTFGSGCTITFGQ
jgi:hypothetical protein